MAADRSDIQSGRSRPRRAIVLSGGGARGAYEAGVLRFILDGNPFTMVYFQHVKPGKGGAFVRTKVKNLLNGRTIERTFRSGERLELADIEEKSMQYLYAEGENLVFMDQQTYDQIPIPPDVIGDSIEFMLENMEVDVLFWNGKPVNIELPNYIVAKVVKSDPGV